MSFKIAPEFYLGNDPITVSIRKMEEMANAYMEAVDIAYNTVALGHKRIVLSDVHRFLSRVSGVENDHPCTGSPCGMGDRVQVINETGEVFACRSLSPGTAAKLRITDRDINCPVESEVLKYWKTDKLQTSNACKRCMWKNLCCGGCPSITYEKYENISREDPRCRFFQMVFEDLIWKVYNSPLIVRKLGGHKS
jgi:radical SAM protein with 4Fe4S-binding SPASM domain